TTEQPDPPPGAIHGYGFTATVGMTSLLGCSGEDFASVLRALGYRVERKPAPVKKEPAAVEIAAPPTDAALLTMEAPASNEDEAVPAAPSEIAEAVTAPVETIIAEEPPESAAAQVAAAPEP